MAAFFVTTSVGCDGSTSCIRPWLASLNQRKSNTDIWHRVPLGNENLLIALKWGKDHSNKDRSSSWQTFLHFLSRTATWPDRPPETVYVWLSFLFSFEFCRPQSGGISEPKQAKKDFSFHGEKNAETIINTSDCCTRRRFESSDIASDLSINAISKL